MILKFRAEDLISVVIEDLSQSCSSIEIECRRVNKMRDKLRINGISTDLGVRELEAISQDYPKNIHIESSRIRVLNSLTFVECFEVRISKYQRDDFVLLKKLWKESK